MSEVKTDIPPDKKASRMSMWATLFFLGTLGFLVAFLKQCDSTHDAQKKYDEESTLTTQLYQVIDIKKAEIDSLKKVIGAGEKAVANLDSKLKEEITKRQNAVDSMTVQARKIKTLRDAFLNGQITYQRLKDSLSASPVFASEDEANAAYLKIVAERDLYRENAKAATQQLGQVTAYNTKLVKATQSVVDTLANRRTKYQNKRAKAGSNVIKQVVNSGRIAVLGEIDDDLKALQQQMKPKQAIDEESDLESTKSA